MAQVISHGAPAITGPADASNGPASKPANYLRGRVSRSGEPGGTPGLVLDVFDVNGRIVRRMASPDCQALGQAFATLVLLAAVPPEIVPKSVLETVPEVVPETIPKNFPETVPGTLAESVTDSRPDAGDASRVDDLTDGKSDADNLAEDTVVPALLTERTQALAASNEDGNAVDWSMGVRLRGAGYHFATLGAGGAVFGRALFRDDAAGDGSAAGPSGWWMLETTVGIVAPRSQEIADGQGRAYTRLYDAALAFCRGLVLSTGTGVTGHVCAVAGAGHLNARSEGLAEVGSGRTWLYRLGGALRLGKRMTSRISVEWAAGVLRALNDVSFPVENSPDVLATVPLAFETTLGAVYSF